MLCSPKDRNFYKTYIHLTCSIIKPTLIWHALYWQLFGVYVTDLGGFEITVEHESASGLTTEVESKWSHVKAEHGDPKYDHYLYSLYKMYFSLIV